ncbi:MAG: AMP-binding protein, partial [Actinomycetota bacterium]|nr:AMP-binding protein [Actinomycetota bacterium]
MPVEGGQQRTSEDVFPAVEPRPPVTLLPEAVEQGARGASADLVFVDAELNERRVGYDELLDGVERAAAALRELGLERGDRVCLAATTSPELVQTLFGAWRAGLVPTMASLPRGGDPSAWLETMAMRVQITGSKAILTAKPLVEMIEPAGVAERTVACEDLVAHPERISEPIEGDPGDVAYLQFTSGSTGTERAVTLGHTQILWNAFHDVGDTFGLTSEDVRVSWLPLYHDFGFVFLLTAVSRGAPLVLQSPEQFVRRPASWMDACSRYGATATAAPNSAYGIAARDLSLNPRELDLSNLRILMNGSEPVDMETVEAFMEAAEPYGIPPNAICAAYGMAEVTLAVAWVRPDQPQEAVTVAREGLGERGTKVELVDASHEKARRLALCGTPDEATDVRVVDENDAELPAWHVGEIVIRGPSMMLGYWEDEESTASTIRDGWVHSGDLGFVTDSGQLVPCGRIKDMIIVGGRNLYPEEYEFLTERVEGVRKGNAIAFSLPEQERMVVVAETKAVDSADEVARRVYDSLRRDVDPPPSEVLVVPPGTIPKTSSGKRQRTR